MAFLYVTDNSGYVRINHISDDARAQVMNTVNYAQNYPIVTSPLLMGGYSYPILDDIVATHAPGSVYQILKASLPHEDERKSTFLNLLVAQRETLYAYVDGDEVTVVQIEGWDRTVKSLSSLGWIVTSGPKTFKRLKNLNRPFRLFDISEEPLRVVIVDDEDYCDEDLEGFSEKEIERLLDGGMVISPRLFQKCLQNVNFPKYVHDANHPELAVDYYRMQEYFSQAQNFEGFNARFFGPMHFIGHSHDEDLVSRPGLLKGEAFKDVGGVLDRMHADVLCARSALKFEVGCTSKTIVLLEPQRAKLAEVNSDLQTMTNLPALFPPEQTSEWVKIFLQSRFRRLCNNELMETWYDMSSPFFNGPGRTFTLNDVLTLTKWNAREWSMSGMKTTQSPWLFEQLGSAIAKTFRAEDTSKIRIPIPCAIRAQVISSSFASAAGEDVTVDRGCARWSPDLQSIVVNDLDWIEMYPSHGGMDLDDFFVAYYRTVGNLRKIILVRSPNDIGEYSIFDYVEGDWYPQEQLDDTTFILFPQVSGDPKDWPRRLSEAIANNEVIYTGLPSELENKTYDSHPYSAEDVKYSIQNNKASASCVGANVNARTLWALTTGKIRPIQLTTMETCIDTGVQGGHQEDIQAVHAEARQIVEDVIATGLPIDSYMWFSRFAPYFNGVPFDRSRLTSKTHISHAYQFRIDAARSFMKMVREYAQTNLKNNIDPRVHELGMKFIRPAYQILVDTRRNMFRMQNSGDVLHHNVWQDVHSLALETIESLEKETDKHDFILALYSACFKAPTTSGRVTDQLVMNPHLFPYLMAALRFYGIAFYIDLDETGKITRRKNESWELGCKTCDTTFTTEDPKVVQRYHTFDGICKDCRTKVLVEA